MKRINVTFYDETYSKLEERKLKKGDKSVAQGIREFVELGFKIEDAAQKNNSNEAANDDLATLINLLKNNLTWSLETRLLARHLVEKNSTTLNDNDKNILETCRERAANYVKGLLGEDE
jgi:predicted CopG family antitoxin